NIHNNTTINRTWDSVSGAITFSFAFAFRNKEEYLAFMRLWKENYAALSVTIRNQKQVVRGTMRKQEHAGEHQGMLRELKHEATMQLQMREASRRESNRQYLASKQAAR